MEVLPEVDGPREPLVLRAIHGNEEDEFIEDSAEQEGPRQGVIQVNRDPAEALLVRMALRLSPNFARLPVDVQKGILTDMRNVHAEVVDCPHYTVPGTPAHRPPNLAYGYADLQELPDRLLAPRKIVRDTEGYLFHPDLPVVDESVRIDAFLAAFGLETEFVGMEMDCPDDPRVDAYFEEDPNCAWWEPTPPEGEGWVLLEIYDTENGPYAMFVRKKPVPPRLSRRQLRDAEEAAREAERQALAKSREGWQVVRVESSANAQVLEQARASWDAYDVAQAASGQGEDII